MSGGTVSTETPGRAHVLQFHADGYGEWNEHAAPALLRAAAEAIERNGLRVFGLSLLNDHAADQGGEPGQVEREVRRAWRRLATELDARAS